MKQNIIKIISGIILATLSIIISILLYLYCTFVLGIDDLFIYMVEMLAADTLLALGITAIMRSDQIMDKIDELS